VWCFTACSPSSGAAFAQHPREHGHAQGIVVVIGLKMDRKDFGPNPHVTYDKGWFRFGSDLARLGAKAVQIGFRLGSDLGPGGKGGS
jgi:hypothetical protein